MLVGVVGKANVGKSTFFKSLTLADVLIANYPFATIEPNKGFGFVRIPCVDVELNTQCNPRTGFCVKHQRFVPVEVMDVAGLVPGAHEGKGLGLSFLDDLRQADVLIHVVDMAGTTNARGEPVEAGTGDPVFDISSLEFELDMWVLSILKKGWEKFSRQLQQEKGDIVLAIAKQLSGLNVTEDIVKRCMQKVPVSENPAAWTEQELFSLAKEVRRMTKPLIVAANKADLPFATKNLSLCKEKFPHMMFIPCSAEAELSLKQAERAKLIEYLSGDSDFKIIGTVTEQQKKALEFIRTNVLLPFGGTGVQTVLNAAVLDLLRYIAIFPGGLNKLADQFGRILPDCFLLPPASTAFDFASKIHSDLARDFIKAIDIRTRRAVGKEHLLKHRDVMEIVT